MGKKQILARLAMVGSIFLIPVLLYFWLVVLFLVTITGTGSVSAILVYSMVILFPFLLPLGIIFSWHYQRQQKYLHAIIVSVAPLFLGIIFMVFAKMPISVFGEYLENPFMSMRLIIDTIITVYFSS